MEGDGLCALTTPAQTRSVEKVTTRMRPNAREFMDPVSSKAWGCECILHSQHSASLLHLRSVVRSLIAIAIAAALFVAWRKILRPRQMLREMGVSGPLEGGNRTCRDQTTPPLVRHCFANRATAGGDERESVSFDRRTKEILFLSRRWSLRDSARAMQTADSVEGAMARHGGRPITCVPVQDDKLRLLEGWRFTSQKVVMYVDAPVAPGEVHGSREWNVYLSGGPFGGRDCEQYGVRLMTPREIIAAMARWFER